MAITILGALLIGVTLGLMGSGGSILTVPVLVYVLGHDGKAAIAESLAIVGGIGLVGVLPYAKSHQVDWRCVAFFGIPGMAGTLGGAWLAQFVSGASSNLPTSKTGAAIRKQAPVVVKNLRGLMAGKPPAAQYNGYTSCPVVTGYGKMVLAEFDYDGDPAEAFPFNQAKDRWSMWIFKKYVLPLLYWKGMLKGRA